MKIRNILKKTLAVILSLAMLAPILSNLEVNVKEVQAAETSTDKSLNVKCQVTQGVVKTTTIDKYKDKYVMRFVSAIEDYTQYKEIGFKLIEEGTTKEKKGVVKTVFKRIESTTGSTADGTKETYTYSPKVINTAGEYFMTAKLPIDNTEAAKATKYTVWAYGIKKDGTKVNGPERCVSVNDGLEGCKTINMSFDNTSAISVSTGDTLTANGLPAEVIGVSKDGKRVHVRITPEETVLKSATLFEFKNGDTKVGDEIFRNLNTKYAGEGTADTSWYDVYKDTTNEFVIATSADLYGFAKAVTSSNKFDNKKVYLVSDIEANKGRANKNNLTWDKATDNNGQDIEPYPWTAIGSVASSYVFNGVFDGQMHTISGIYMKTSEMYQGLFSGTGVNAKLKNFYLQNSYFYHEYAANTYGTGQFGSVVGNALGEFNTIYSDAIVLSDNNYAGGIIGSTSTSNRVDVKNCWFAGEVKNVQKPASYFGGFIGRVMTTTTIKNCMNTGNVHNVLAGTSGVGGFIGHMRAGTASISNCLNTGTFTVKSGATNYGRFVGKPEGGTLSISYSYSSPQEDMALVYGKDSTAYQSCGQYEGTAMADAKVLTTNIQSLFSNKNADGTYESYWSFTKDSYPVLTSFAKQLNITAQAVDTSWYIESDDVSTYTLKDSGDLYGFALLARSSDFTGKTIQLGADIEVNTGKSTAEGWNKNQSADGTDITNGTDFMWLPIGNTSKYFNGTFDGQMHTISGIYLDTTTSYQGLFGATNENANISNFYLKNSYFVSTGATSTQMLGSIVGNARGTFANIYSNAIVESRGCTYAAGMIGGTAGSSTVTMSNCWFDGSVSANVVQSYYGGFVGVARTKTTLTNCLNTADITHNGDVGTAGIGGFVGRVTENGNVDIYYSVNTGNVIRQYSRSQNYGLFIGKIDDGKTVNASYSHSVHHGKQLVGASSGGGTSPYSTCHRFNADVLAGLNALTTTYDNVKKLFTDDDAKGHWSITTNSFPVLTTFANEVDVATQAVDTSWYDGTNEYTLYDSGDLYGFALLSQSNTFEDSKIKLGADITINQDMENPDFEWLPIGKFNGEFDGQMHTISGVYSNRGSNINTALFAETLAKSTIKNLYLKDSYFESTAARVASIAGTGAGKFYNIYSNADVVSSSNWIGGFVGLGATAGVEMERCWFDGTVTNNMTNTVYKGTGGFIGQQNGGTASFAKCLNTGTINLLKYDPAETETSSPDVGGFVGYVTEGGVYVTIDSSLNAGTINKNAEVQRYGRFVGYKKSDATVTISNSYATENTWVGDDANYALMTYEIVSEQDIIGNNAKSTMPLLDWENDWKCVTGQLPQVRFSESDFGANVTNTVSVEDGNLLTSAYHGMELAFGDMHAHAKESHESDAFDRTYEAKALTTWEGEMSSHGLNFIASLDHKQTDHIMSEKWDTDKFLFGTEAGTKITGMETSHSKSGEMHYNILFAAETKQEAQRLLEDVLSKVPQLGYQNSRYSYGDFTKQEFTALILKVQQAGGFFVVPHPNYEHKLIPPLSEPKAPFSDNWKDYDFGVDKVGFEVVERSLSEPATQLNYKYWKQLLASGRKYFACAGSDIHGSLNGDSEIPDKAQKAITSVYVSEKNSLAYLEQFKEGNFTAGSVGIQMCVGTTTDAKPTAMGGSCDFARKRLVVKIGDFHQYVNKPDRKYHVDIVTDKGVIYSQPLTLTENGPQDAVIAFDTDEKYMFYRVEVVDENDVRRIAYGNPIWNTNVAAK